MMVHYDQVQEDYARLNDRIAELEQQSGLADIELRSKSVQLRACEKSLLKRDERIAELEATLTSTDTTGKQKYACNGEFFVATEVKCPCQDDTEDLDIRCDICGNLGSWIQKEAIPWTTIKDIWKAMIKAREL